MRSPLKPRSTDEVDVLQKGKPPPLFPPPSLSPTLLLWTLPWFTVCASPHTAGRARVGVALVFDVLVKIITDVTKI